MFNSSATYQDAREELNLGVTVMLHFRAALWTGTGLSLKKKKAKDLSYWKKKKPEKFEKKYMLKKKKK